MSDINPDHYHSGGMEAIDVIEAFFPDSPHLANVFKYTSRAGKKDGQPILREYKKALWYLGRYIRYEFGDVALTEALAELSFPAQEVDDTPRVFQSIEDIPVGLTVRDIGGDEFTVIRAGHYYWWYETDQVWDFDKGYARNYAPFTEVK